MKHNVLKYLEDIRLSILDIVAPMEFEILLNNEIENGELKREINFLLIKKRSGEELDTGDHISVIDSFVEDKLNYYKEYLEGYNFKNSPGFDELNKIFRTSLKEAWD